MRAILQLSLTLVTVVLFMSLAARGQQGSTNPVELAQDGWAAVEAQRYGDALRAFTEATELVDYEPTLWLGRGYAEYMLGRDDDAEHSLERVLALDETSDSAYQILGELHYRSGRVADAIKTYETARRQATNGRDFEARLEEWKQESQLQDGFAHSTGAHFLVLFEGPTDDALARRIIDVLEGAYRNVGNTLRTYPPQTINVLLYTQQQFQDITRAPAWSGGVYDGQIRLPSRGALERPGELERVLTHEYVHALVALLGGRTVPTWLNEGLATALEPGGLDHASRVLASVSGRPSLRDLHGGFGRLPGDMATVAYAQSAVAVNRMMYLRGGASGVVLLLQDLAAGVPFESAFQRRMGLWYDEFVRMARNLD